MNHTTKGVVVIGASVIGSDIAINAKAIQSATENMVYTLNSKHSQSKDIYFDFIKQLDDEFDIMRINSVVGGDDFTVHDIRPCGVKITKFERELSFIIKYEIEVDHNDSDEDFAFDDIPSTVASSILLKMIKERVANHLLQHLHTLDVTSNEQLSVDSVNVVITPAT